jgi:lysophospholipase L1-like esterase
LSSSTFAFKACSGAILADISENVTGPGQWDDGPQLDAISPFGTPSTDTTLVTLSIGGNDAGFSDALVSCIRGSFHNQLFHGDCRHTIDRGAVQGINLLKNGGTIRIDKTAGTWQPCDRGSRSRSCQPGFANGHVVTKSVADLAGMLGKIRDRAPNAHIVLMLYPHLFSPVPKGKCIVGQRRAPAGNTQSYTLDRDAIVDMNNQTDKMDDAIKAEVMQAQQAGIHADFADPRVRFDADGGHGVACLTDPAATTAPWINGLKFDGGAFIGSVSASPFSFHPNASGQAQFAGELQGKL